MRQEQVLDTLKNGNNVFLTGAAGTGKTYVLKKFIEWLKETKISHAITASTGIAATHLNGNTIHSWSGIGIREKLSKQDISNIKSNIKSNYRAIKVLIIDEISMLHAHQLNMVDTIAKHCLNKIKPFGGLQIVFCGDFCQLPPVTRDNQDVIFAYESAAWKQSNLKICYLTQQYRQKNNDNLSDILNSIRSGQINLDIRSKLNNLIVSKREDEITKLYTNNIDVDLINKSRLSKINNESHSYKMTEWGSTFHLLNLKKYCLAKETIELKQGALIIFIQNDRDKRYVNGTLGIITSFSKQGMPIVTTNNGDVIYVNNGEWKVEDSQNKVLAYISQLPICLAWAITIHKSQGMTLDAAEIDLTKAFCYGMGYVALSRIRDYSGLRLLGFNEKALQIDPKMLKQDQIFKELSCQ